MPSEGIEKAKESFGLDRIEKNPVPPEAVNQAGVGLKHEAEVGVNIQNLWEQHSFTFFDFIFLKFM